MKTFPSLILHCMRCITVFVKGFINKETDNINPTGNFPSLD